MKPTRRRLIAFSGGADSTAMVLRLAEMGEQWELFHTPTGDELPPVAEHVSRVTDLTGYVTHNLMFRSLYEWIERKSMLPNARQRWCTEALKIHPCIAFLRPLDSPVLAVGLRADEPTRRGLYGDYAEYRYPLREWGWTRGDVLAYLDQRGVCVPERTDCALCPFQRLGEWYRLWRDWPEYYQRGVDAEEKIGRTIRSDSRDSWPAGLADLAECFETGRIPRHGDQGELFPVESCRICRM